MLVACMVVVACRLVVHSSSAYILVGRMVASLVVVAYIRRCKLVVGCMLVAYMVVVACMLVEHNPLAYILVGKMVAS